MFHNDDFEEPNLETKHWIPLDDWVLHTPAPWCACKPVYDADFNEYFHPAVDDRLSYVNGRLTH